MKSADTTDPSNIFTDGSIRMQISKKLNELLNKFRHDRQSRVIIIVILCISLFFILFNCLLQAIIYFNVFEQLYFGLNLDSGGLRIHHDGSIPELFNYLQTTVCAGLLLGVFRATRQPVYSAWALIFLFVVIDDSLKIHERVAADIVTTFGLPPLPGLRPQDLGELLVWAMIGSVLLGILWWGFAQSRNGARAAGAVLGLPFLALIFFAIGIDMIHVMFAPTSAVASALLPILEDGGEMLSIGLACALALLLYRHPTIAG